ncbi:unnamed protein product [Owenia fusiformis]|uniref:Uncharacterized protein n=1 Tax=Owenia fusiformis TaxID=6347 RepID=A0A8J1TKI1_OWEFU|nr:unnamed protein product [Owenia fusiformis]
MGFCGEIPGIDPNSTNITLSVSPLENECFIDMLSIIPHSLLLVISIPILIVWNKSHYGSIPVQSWVHFPGHNIRYILTIALIVMNLFELAEGVLSDSMYQGLHLHLYVPHCVSVAASIMTLVYYHNVEMWNSPRFLLLTLLYWMSALTIKCLKVFCLFKKNLGIVNLRFDLTWDVIVVYFFLLIVELNVLRMLRYALSSNPRVLVPPEDLSQGTKFVQPYSNFLSKFSYWWLNGMLSEGYKHALEVKQLGKLPETEHSVVTHETLSRIFEEEKAKAAKKGKKPSLSYIYLRAYWPWMLVAGIFKLIGDLLAFVGPWTIEKIVLYVTEAYNKNQLEKETGNVTVLPQEVQYISVVDFINNGYVLSIILFLATVLQNTFLQSHFYLVIREAVRLKGALQAMIYKKTLRLSGWTMSSGEMTQGQIVNHVSTDCFHLQMMFFLFHFVWTMPIQIAITMFLLYNVLGSSALIGGSIILLISPIQYKVAAVIANIQKQTLEKSDLRLKQCNEMLQGIKLLKLYAWEILFCEKVQETRMAEVRLLLKGALLCAFTLFITEGTPLLVTLVTFTIYPYIQNEPLTASKAFASLALFNILALPLFLFPVLVNTLVNAKVSNERILPFLLAPEVEGSNFGQSGGESGSTLQKETNGNDVKVAYKKGASKPIEIQNGGEGVDGATQGMDRQLSNLSQMSDASADELEDGAISNAVEVKNAEFSWDLKSETPDLKALNFEIQQEKLTMIVGSTGCGKSSMLSAIMGEMCTKSGTVNWNPDCKISFAAQKAWLINATLKDNILFGEPYEKKRYKRVLQACALQPDIDILPAGDQTEIGEKGINMSGGQKQRISVARAMYSKADVVVLDDPLSALDVHVGQTILEEGILKFLLKHRRTVVLVTHQLQYISQADKIIVVQDGTISHQGNLSDIKMADIDLYEQWKESIQSTRVKSKSSSGSTSEDAAQESLQSKRRQFKRQITRDVFYSQGANQMRSLQRTKSINKQVGLDLLGEEYEKEEGATGKLIDEEEREKGSVSAKVYLAYFKACWLVLAGGVLILHLFRQSIIVGTDFWLSAWSTASSLAASNLEAANMANDLMTAAVNGTLGNDSYLLLTTTPSPGSSGIDSTTQYYINGYAGLSVAAITLAFCVSLISELAGVRAAFNLHNNMLKNVVLAPMRFFDTTPMGRILNRFSADTCIIDEKLPMTLEALVRTILLCLSSVIVNTVATPYFLIAAVPVFIVYFFLQKFFRASSRELQRCDTISKSPVFAHFSETLGGLSTIRAYRDETRFMERIHERIDSNNTAYLYLNTANRWLGIRLDYMGAIIVFAAAITTVATGVTGAASPGVVGLSITYALMVSSYLNWVVRNLADAEMEMNTVERVVAYTELSTEPYVREEAGITPPESWPEKGAIVFQDVSLRYDSSLDPVVHNVDINIKPGEKVGICGRTGSGKSSMTLGLFRIIETCGGTILIDDIDINRIPLTTLRSKLSIIPQDPVLFAGTVRYNLDPFDQQTDEQLWKALEVSQLKDIIHSSPEKLNYEVSEGGENFSVGQRQLFCIARAFLRDAAVLVMDEATASVDMETDQLIQKVVAEHFGDRTILTIAHRVATILTSDTIIVLDQGRIVEYDSPTNLLKDEQGVFFSLVKQNK